MMTGQVDLCSSLQQQNMKIIKNKRNLRDHTLKHHKGDIERLKYISFLDSVVSSFGCSGFDDMEAQFAWDDKTVRQTFIRKVRECDTRPQ